MKCLINLWAPLLVHLINLVHLPCGSSIFFSTGSLNIEIFKFEKIVTKRFNDNLWRSLFFLLIYTTTLLSTNPTFNVIVDWNLHCCLFLVTWSASTFAYTPLCSEPNVSIFSKLSFLSYAIPCDLCTITLWILTSSSSCLCSSCVSLCYSVSLFSFMKKASASNSVTFSFSHELILLILITLMSFIRNQI